LEEVCGSAILRLTRLESKMQSVKPTAILFKHVQIA